MKKNIIHAPLFRIFVPIPYGTLIYLLLLMINNNLLIIDESFISVELFFCIGLSYITQEVNRLVIITLFRKNKLTMFENLMQMAVNAMITLVIIYFSLMLYFNVFLGYASLTGFTTEVKSFAIFFGITSLLYNLLSISYSLLNKKNEQLFEDEQTLKEHVQFELDNYQAEVNPDLLFESLESAITLIHQDVNQAEDFIDQLALVYRYMLTNRGNEAILVKNEIDAAENLIYLHNVRHSELITLTIKSPLDDESIIPGSLPILIEEIIKSNIISQARPLEIVIAKEDDYLTLTHRLNERLKKNENEILTFKRLQVAYSFYTDQPLVKVQAYGEAFYKIPLINIRDVAA